MIRLGFVLAYWNWLFERVNTYIEPSVIVYKSFEETEDTKSRRVLSASSLVPELKRVCLLAIAFLSSLPLRSLRNQRFPY